MPEDDAPWGKALSKCSQEEMEDSSPATWGKRRSKPKAEEGPEGEKPAAPWATLWGKRKSLDPEAAWGKVRSEKEMGKTHTGTSWGRADSVKSGDPEFAHRRSSIGTVSSAVVFKIRSAVGSSVGSGGEKGAETVLPPLEVEPFPALSPLAV